MWLNEWKAVPASTNKALPAGTLVTALTYHAFCVLLGLCVLCQWVTLGPYQSNTGVDQFQRVSLTVKHNMTYGMSSCKASAMSDAS